jgi:hypothetical protein
MRRWNTPLRADVADTHQDLLRTLEGEGAHMWVLREADAHVGMVGLLGDVAVPGLSWLLCRQAWGRGLMTEAAGAVVEYAFGSLGLDRVEAWVEATMSGRCPLPDGSASSSTAVWRNGIRTGHARTRRSFSVGRANRNPPPPSVWK